MAKEVKKIILQDEDGLGAELELEVIIEFEHKDKKYIVLYGNNCDSDECESDFTCDCYDEEEDGDCTCHCHNNCDGHIYILEITKDKDGNERYKEIDEDLIDELLPIVEKKLYPTEK